MDVRARWRAAPVGVGAGIGFVVLGVIGVVVGLVIGLIAYPATAWAAAIELGAPSVVVGSVVGAGVGLCDLIRRRF